MQNSVIATSLMIGRVALLSGILTLVGLFVGISCAILSPSIPFAVVGIAALIFLWTLPDLQSVPDRLSRWLIYPLIVSCISIPAYFAIILPGIPWISIRRLILFTFVAAVVFTISASSTNRRALIEVGRRSTLLTTCTLGYFILTLATMLISAKPSDSINYVVNTTIGWWIPLLAILSFVRRIEDIIRILAVIVGCMVFDMAMGVIETHLRSPFLIYMMPSYMRAQMITQFPMYAGLLFGQMRNGIYRAVSTYNTALSWGEMSAMAGPLAAHFLAHGRSGFVKTVGMMCLAGSLFSIFMSGSRGGYVGFTAAMIVYFALWAVRHMRIKPASLAGGITLVLYSMFSIAVVLSIFFVGRIHRVVLGGGEVQASNDGRALEWALAMPKIYKSPIWGHGPGVAADVVGFYTQAGNTTLDSYLINVLVDTGFLGMILFAGMILGSSFTCLWFYITNTSKTSAPCGAIGCSLIAYALYRITLSQTENNMLAYILVGLTFVINSILSTERTRQEAKSTQGIERNVLR